MLALTIRRVALRRAAFEAQQDDIKAVIDLQAPA